MKKQIILTAITAMFSMTIFGQCSSMFSFAAYFETVSFYNQSSFSNAHYFWNFGDGTGSNYNNPIHKFPETGNYLVTLFAKDTISNCSSYYEYWINVVKYSNDSCQTSISDSIFYRDGDYFLRVIDNSQNCQGYNSIYDMGPAHNFSSITDIILLNWGHAKFISRVKYSTNDTINGYILHREAYKSSPFLYTSLKNYGDCSANFEFKVVSQDSIGQRILFTAMNKTATYYRWNIITSGNTSNNDTISNYFTYHPYMNNDISLVGLYIIGYSGCKDTLYQDILVRNNEPTIENINESTQDFQYNIYPNPFLDQAVLSFPIIHQKVTFTLYNINSQLVRNINNNTDGQIIINRNGLASGLYYFILRTDEKVIVTGKLIAE